MTSTIVLLCSVHLNALRSADTQSSVIFLYVTWLSVHLTSDFSFPVFDSPCFSKVTSIQFKSRLMDYNISIWHYKYVFVRETLFVFLYLFDYATLTSFKGFLSEFLFLNHFILFFCGDKFATKRLLKETDNRCILWR